MELGSSCVAINPEFKHKTISLSGGLIEMTSATNVVLGPPTIPEFLDAVEANAR